MTKFKSFSLLLVVQSIAGCAVEPATSEDILASDEALVVAAQRVSPETHVRSEVQRGNVTLLVDSGKETADAVKFPRPGLPFFRCQSLDGSGPFEIEVGGCTITFELDNCRESGDSCECDTVNETYSGDCSGLGEVR